MRSKTRSTLSAKSANFTESQPMTLDSCLTSESSSISTCESGPITPQQEKQPQLYKPGQSGNPLGRPKGSKNQITLLKLSLEQALRERAAPQMQAVLDKAFDMALKGHPGMLKLLLELHISKTSDKDDSRSADDKITIHINQMPSATTGYQPVVIEGETVQSEPSGSSSSKGDIENVS